MRQNLSRATAFIVFFVTVFVLLALDRYTKFLAVSALSDGGSVALIPGVLDLMLVYNEGAAFGILQGARLYFIIVATLASLGIIVYIAITKRHSLVRVFALALICTGAVGNAIDRALSGKVVDFIHTLFIEFPVFNIADSAITLGVIVLVFSLFFPHEHRSGKHLHREALSSRNRARLDTDASGHSVDSEPDSIAGSDNPDLRGDRADA
ncbi:MAG: signal peptidase II [Coriobacteriaceae bacterium]|nr:signal peptidase II [Coriobacteriaceae bacterium]